LTEIDMNFEFDRDVVLKRRSRRGFLLFVLLFLGFFALVILYTYQYNKVVELNYEIMTIQKEINRVNLERQRLEGECNMHIYRVIHDEMSGYRIPDMDDMVWIKEPRWMRYVK